MRRSPNPSVIEAHEESCAQRNKVHEPHLETVIADLAADQHGVVALHQLQMAGLSRSAVSRRAAVGRLHRVHRGVYAVGRPKLDRHGQWLAAVLACGAAAVLSHRSAAALWGLRHDQRRCAEVCVQDSGAHARDGIDVHVSGTLTDADVTTVDGIPCTAVARTLVDLGDVVPRRAVERAIDQAELLRLFDLRAVEAALERAGPRRGAGTLRALLDGYEEPTLTDRELEERLLALCRTASLPSPAVNAWITLGEGVTYKADFLWRKERLVVETDSRRFQGHRKAFEHDRLRDQRLTLAGFTVIRFTWRQVTDDPRRVAEVLRGLLARLARP
jgi:very-short-patch-repair endonuclease